METYNIVGRIQ